MVPLLPQLLDRVINVKIPAAMERRSYYQAMAKQEGWFNVLDNERYCVLRLGAADAGIPNWQNKLAVGLTQNNSFAGVDPIASTPVTVLASTWYTIKMNYIASTGTIQAKIWLRDSESEPGSWQIEVTDTTWKHGAFGFRAAPNAKYDNLYINGFKTYYQPIPVGDWL